MLYGGRYGEEGLLSERDHVHAIGQTGGGARGTLSAVCGNLDRDAPSHPIQVGRNIHHQSIMSSIHILHVTSMAPRVNRRVTHLV